MIVNSKQAKEVGEALVDASQRTTEDKVEHYVVYLDEQEKAVCLPVDPNINSYEYNILAHVKKP